MIGTKISNHGVTVDVWNHASGEIHDWWDNYRNSEWTNTLGNNGPWADELASIGAADVPGTSCIRFNTKADFTMFLLRFS